MEIVDVTDLAGSGDFKVFADAVSDGGVVRGSAGAGGAGFLAQGRGRSGCRGRRASEPRACCPCGSRSRAALSSAEVPERRAVRRSGRTARGEPGDLLLFVAGRKKVVEPSLGALRLALAERLGVKREGWAFSWILDFPMFEYDEKEKRLKAQHHPFTKPRLESLEDLQTRPLELGTYAYDLVLNGVELGSGSLRISDPRLQEAVFAALGLSRGRNQGQVRLSWWRRWTTAFRRTAAWGWDWTGPSCSWPASPLSAMS